MNQIEKFLLVIFVFTSFRVFSQPGTLDKTFGDNGISNTNLLTAPTAITLQSEGKILIANSTTISSFQKEGSANTSFGDKGSITIMPLRTYYRTLTGSGNDQILAAGITYSGYFYDEDLGQIPDYNFCIIKYKSNGITDSGFGANGIASYDFGSVENLTSIALQQDGKIIAAGYTSYPDLHAIVQRFNKDGSIDEDFGENGEIVVTTGSAVKPAAIALQADGKIVVAGTYNYTQYPSFTLMRFLQDGSSDKDFGENGIVISDFGSNTVYEYLAGLAMADEGKIVAVGYNKLPPFYSRSNMLIARYNSDGSADESFGNKGSIITAIENYDIQGNAVAVQQNNKIIVGGTRFIYPYNQTSDFILTRYKATDGSLDSSFGENGIVITSIGEEAALSCLKLEIDGNIIAAGPAPIGTTSYTALARYFGDPTHPFIARIKRWIRNHTLHFTDDNKDVAYYTIEQQISNSTWQEITTILPRQQTREYSYQLLPSATAHSSPIYRIKILSKSGAITYSEPITDNTQLTNYTINQLTITPNPAKDFITISGLDAVKKYEITIMNNEGIVILSAYGKRSTVNQINISALKAGIYFLKINDNEGNINSLKFIKQ